MTNDQLYFAVGLPTLINAVLFGILLAFVNARIDGLRAEVNLRIDSLRVEVNARFDTVDARFATAREQLLRVEGVLDARLGNVEQRLKALEERVH